MLQKQYESMQQFNDGLHEKGMENLKSEHLASRDTRDNERKIEDEARESTIKARKAESIAQTRDEEAEQLRSTCARVSDRRNELQDELNELANDQTTALPKFGDQGLHFSSQTYFSFRCGN